MTLFQLLLLIHILAAAIWIGGGIVTSLVGRLLYNEKNTAALSGYCGVMAKLGGPVFGGSSTVVLATGVWMVAMDGGPTFGATWVSVGFTAWILSFIFGGVIGGRQFGIVGKELADGKSIDQISKRWQLAERSLLADHVVRIVAVVFMVWRP